MLSTISGEDSNYSGKDQNYPITSGTNSLQESKDLTWISQQYGAIMVSVSGMGHQQCVGNAMLIMTPTEHELVKLDSVQGLCVYC